MANIAWIAMLARVKVFWREVPFPFLKTPISVLNTAHNDVFSVRKKVAQIGKGGDGGGAIWTMPKRKKKGCLNVILNVIPSCFEILKWRFFSKYASVLQYQKY